MEMDITESSSFMSEDPSLDLSESSYLSGLRNIRGRRSYKQLKEMTIKKVDRSLRTVTGAGNKADTKSYTRLFFKYYNPDTVKNSCCPMTL